MGPNPLVRAWRHRRQYADHAGPRPAAWAGLVRPPPASSESAGRVQHPLVAPGRPAHRGADPGAEARFWRSRGGALGSRDCAVAAIFAAALFARADGASAARTIGLRAGFPDVVLRRVDPRHVHAGADRTPWLG